MNNTLKLAKIALILELVVLAGAGAMLLYPWSSPHGGVFECGPVRLEAGGISGSLLWGFELTDVRAAWTGQWRLEAERVHLIPHLLNLAWGRVKVSGDLEELCKTGPAWLGRLAGGSGEYDVEWSAQGGPEKMNRRGD